MIGKEILRRNCTGTRYLLPFILLFIFTLHGQAQTRGQVMDAETGTPVYGALITSGKEQHITGPEGYFLLDSLVSPLITTHLGYKPDTVFQFPEKGNIMISLVPDYTRLEQIIVRGPLIPGSLMEMPAGVSLLTAGELDRITGQSFISGLNRIPGIFAHSGSLNTNRITIRGIGSRTPYGTNRIRALYQGIPITSGDGNTSLEDIDPHLIHSVEVIKGSKSAAYGPGLGGIVLLEGRNYYKPGWHGSAEMKAGSWGSYSPALHLDYKKGAFSVSSGWASSWSDGWRENSSYKRHCLNTNASWELSRLTTKIVLYFVDIKAFIPSSLDQSTFDEDPQRAAAGWLAVKGYESYNRLLAGISNTIKISSHFTGDLVLYGNIYRGYESRPFNILDDESLQGGLRFSLRYSHNNWQVRSGLEFMEESYQWRIFETLQGRQGLLQNSYSEKRRPVNMFLMAGYHPVEGGILEAGLSYNFLTYALTDELPDSINRSGSYRYDPVWSPFLGVNLPLGDQFHVYSSVGHGFSYPTVEETLLPDGQVNTALKPESGITLEAGTRFSALEGDLFADASVYLLWVRDLLVTERLDEDLFTGKNAGKTRHAGFEFQSSLRLNKRYNYRLPEARLALSLQLSDQQFTRFIDDGTDYGGNKLPGVPSNNIFTELVIRDQTGLSASLQYLYVGEQYMDDGNSVNYDAWSVFHLRTGWEKTIGKTQLTVYLGIQNLFNTHYASMLLVNAPSFGGASPRYYYPGEPRNFHVGFSFEF